MDGQLQRSVPAPISPWASDRVAAAVAAITPLAARRTAAVKPGLARVLEAFAAERLGPHHSPR